MVVARLSMSATAESLESTLPMLSSSGTPLCSAIASDGFITTLRRALCIAKASTLGEILLVVLLCFVVVLQVINLCLDGHRCLHKQPSHCQVIAVKTVMD